MVTQTDVPMISRSADFPPELGLKWLAQGDQHIARLKDDAASASLAEALRDTWRRRLCAPGSKSAHLGSFDMLLHL
jgi:hypothetical protein